MVADGIGPIYFYTAANGSVWTKTETGAATQVSTGKVVGAVSGLFNGSSIILFGEGTDHALWFTTGTEEQKYLNLTVNPQVALTTGCNGWESGLDVVVEGEARHVTDQDALERAAMAFAVKWRGAWQFAVRDGRFYNHGSADWPCEAFSVTPARVFAHDKGEPFGATTHRF